MSLSHILAALIAASSSSSILKSVQTGEITIAAGASSGTATINAVNTGRSICLFNGWRSADTSLVTTEDYIRVDLTDSTTVTAQTNSSNAATSRIARYTIVEFDPDAIKSVQQSTIAIGGSNTSATATITAVDTTRAFVVHLGQTHSTNNTNFNYNQGRLDLTNATTVTAQKDSGSNPTLTVGFAVLEFRAGIIKSIQQITALTILAANTTQDATITAVDDTASLLVWGGFGAHLFANADPRYMPYVYRTSTTNVRAARTQSSFVETLINCTVVEFYPRWVKSRQAAQTQIASGQSSANATITAINTDKAFLSWLSHTCSANVTGDEAVYTTAKINSATQVTINRGGTPANTVTNSWEVMEFV